VRGYQRAFRDLRAAVGSGDDGLFRWQPRLRRFANFRRQPGDSHSLPDNTVASLYRDRVGTFWVGTWYAGVSRVDLGSGGFSRIVRQAGSAASLSDNKVRAIVDDGAGRLWLATSDGLDHFDPASGVTRVERHLPANPNSLSDSVVNAVVRDRRGLVWTGGRFGVTSFDPASGRFARQSLANGDPTATTSAPCWPTAAATSGFPRVAGCTSSTPSRASSRPTATTRPTVPAWPTTWSVRSTKTGAGGCGSAPSTGSTCWTARAANSATSGTIERPPISHTGALPAGRPPRHHLPAPRRPEPMIEGPGGSVRFKRCLRRRAGRRRRRRAARRRRRPVDQFEHRADALYAGHRHWRIYSANDAPSGRLFDGSALKGDGSLYFGGFNGITAFNRAASATT
jgi:hypothetical protein